MDFISSTSRKFFEDGGLTVPEASGIIAAGVFIVQFLFPILLPIVLLAFIKDTGSVATLSNVSWSVVGRFLHSSYWPTILSADSASNTGVPSRIVAAVRFRILIAALTAIAGIVTPIGLYEVILASGSQTPSSFHYVPDPSQFGYGTPPRTGLPWSRICGGIIPVACPNSFSKVDHSANATGESSTVYNYDSHVPPYVVDAFQSGLTTGAFNRSVSSIFDIQSRYYTWSLKSKHPDRDQPDDGASYPLSSVRQIANTIMDRKIGLVEGLIVDTVNGGIGFRNHSAPPHQTPYGSEWSEDILFVQPESQCVDTNLTLDFMIPEFNAQRGLVANLVLTDRGGFANLNQTYPEVDMSDLQHSPNLYDRAYKGAWLNNANTMLFLNVTNPNNKSEGSHAFDYLKSTVGKRFPLAYKDSSGDSGAIVDPYMLQTSTLFGAYIFGLDKGVHSLNVTMLNGANTTVPSKRPLYPNPFNIDSSTFSSAEMICAGAGGDDTASINTVSSECGLLYGAPQPDHKNNSILLTPGSNWSIPMYSCISTTKALIRTVDFRYNGSNDDLSSVTVTGLRDKEYHSESSKPLWGVEKTNETLNNVLPLWGLISSPDQGNISLSTLRKEYLYLPGYVGVSTASGKGYQNLPGVNFHSQALSAAFQIGSTGGDEYSGSNNIALFRHWQQYSGDPSSAGRILDLVWTDRVANAVVGTRGLHDPAPEAANKTQVPVTYYQRRIRYHLPYAIPAILTLALAALAILGALMSCIRSPGTGKMKRLLTKTSQGRILYARASRDAGTAPGFTQVKEGSVAAREFSIPVIGSTSDREWRRTIGRKMVPVAKDGDQLVILDSDVRAAEPLLQGHAVAE